MINNKPNDQQASGLCFGATLSSPPSISSPLPTYDNVLQDLFRARLDCSSVRRERCTNERPMFGDPLVMSGPSLFESSKGWNPANSLLHHLGQQKPLKAVSSKDSSTNVANNTPPFPWHATLFPTMATTTPNNTRPGPAGDAELDQRIQSLTASFRSNATETSRPINMPIRRRLSGKKRPRNIATRYRLVGQVLGPKGIQQLVSTVKELKHLHSTVSETAHPVVQNLLNDKILVEAWENTPLDKLKSLPWEDMLDNSLDHIQAYNAWKTANNK